LTFRLRYQTNKRGVGSGRMRRSLNFRHFRRMQVCLNRRQTSQSIQKHLTLGTARSRPELRTLGCLLWSPVAGFRKRKRAHAMDKTASTTPDLHTKEDSRLDPERCENRCIITVGASAGGVEALQQLVRGFPTDLQAAVFIVLHVGSSSHLAAILGRAGPLPCADAANGADFETGRIYVAPPGQGPWRSGSGPGRRGI
jgi:chemotaxis response regulator CheB